MKNTTLIFLLVLTGYSLFSQNVAINTTGAVSDPSAMLDVSSTNTGVLVPRLALTATNVAAPVTAPTNSLLIYNTATAGAGTATGVSPGFYYWSTAANAWIRILNNGDAWLTTGNWMGANGVFGTLTNFSVILGTNNVARGAFVNTGELFLNPALTYFIGDVFSSYATGGNFAVNGYLSGAGAGIAGYFESTSTGGSNAGFFSQSSNNATSGVVDMIRTAGAGWNLYVQSPAASTQPAVAGTTANLTSTAVAGSVNGTFTINTLVGGSGGAFTHPTTGVYATGGTTGVSATGTTVATGIGGNFSGNNVGVYTLANGAGVIGAGTRTGVYGIGSTAANGIGGLFSGNNLVATLPANGAGVSATAEVIGIYGETSGNTNGDMGGYFQRNGGTFIARVCENNAGTDQKIRGTGAVATVVKDLDGNEVTMFCPESPEVLFQDFGQAQLVNGKASIKLDPVFAKNVTIDNNHPLRVIIQLEGDCKGVFVTNKTATGFEVKELNGGTSNVPFTYFVTANRADRVENGEKLSEFDDVRFLKGEKLAIDVIVEQPSVKRNEEIQTSKEVIEINKKEQILQR